MLLQRVERFSQSPTFQRLCAEKYFSADAALGDAALDFRRRDVWKFLDARESPDPRGIPRDGIAAADDELRDEGAARRLVFNLCQIFGESLEKGDSSGLLQRVQGLKDYFHKQYAGQKDEKDVQTLMLALNILSRRAPWEGPIRVVW
eukprot:g6779.t1